jgi:hypothetical protein
MKNFQLIFIGTLLCLAGVSVAYDETLIARGGIARGGGGIARNPIQRTPSLSRAAAVAGYRTGYNQSGGEGNYYPNQPYYPNTQYPTAPPQTQYAIPNFNPV